MTNQFIPTVFFGPCAKVGKFDTARLESDQFEVVRLNNERGSFSLRDDLRRIDQDRAVVDYGCSGCNVLAVTRDYNR